MDWIGLYLIRKLMECIGLGQVNDVCGMCLCHREV